MKKNAQDGSMELDETIDLQEGKRKKKKKRRLTVFFSMLVVCVLLYTFFSGFIINALLGSGHERLAVSCYNAQIYKGFIDSNIFDKHIDKLRYKYMENSGNGNEKSEQQKFNTVKIKLKAIESIVNKKISDRSKSVLGEIEINYTGWSCLDRAEKKFKKEQYLDSIIELKKVDKKFVQYDAVQDLLDDSKTELFTSVECPNSDDEYKSAIELMNKCYECLNEQQYNERSQSLKKEYTQFQAVEDYIAKADKAIQEQKYIEAVSCLKEISGTYPNEKHLISALEDANNILFFSTAEKVKSLSEKEQYNKALDELNKAREVYTCKDFEQLYTDIESKSSKLLWLKNKALDFKDSVVGFFKKDVQEVKKDGGLSYVEKSGKKIVLGDYSKDDINVLSCVGDGALALTGLDAAQDIRDITYDIQHIGEEDNWVVRLAVDTIAVVPVIGTVKYLKYLKQTGKATDAANNIGTAVKAVDKVTAAAKTAGKVGDITKESNKLLDKLKDTKLGNLVAEKKKLKSYTRIERFQGMAGEYAEGTSIKYFKRKLIYKDGSRIMGNFPDFKKVCSFQCKLPDDLLKSTDYLQFKECTRQLRKQIKIEPSLKKKFTKGQLEQIESGASKIEGLTWHHNEEEGVMQLVDEKIHSKVDHTGGRFLWGGGTEAR